MVTVDADVSRDDWSVLNAYLRRLPINRPSKKAARRNWMMLMPVLVLFVVGFVAVQPSWGAHAMAGAFLGYPFVARSIERRNCEAVVEGFSGRISLGSDGITMERAGQSSAWVDPRAVADITVTDDHVLVCTGRLRGVVVPRRCFADADEMDRALRAIEELRAARTA